jgi:hypothetical protein
MIKYMRRIYVFTLILALMIQMLLLNGCKNFEQNYDKTESSLINEYTTTKDDYAVVMTLPSQNKVISASECSPIFYWNVLKGIPDCYYIEIDYMNNGQYIVDSVRDSNTYLLPEEVWKMIKENAPIVDGLQIIHWRIRIEYPEDQNREPYYTGWNYFLIETE